MGAAILQASMEKLGLLTNLAQAQFTFGMPRHNLATGPCRGCNVSMLQVAVRVSPANVWTLGLSEEIMQVAAGSSSMNILHMASSPTASFPPLFCSSFEDDDTEHFFLSSDSDFFHDDDDQATKDFLQSFRSVEDLNDHLFKTWWEQFSHCSLESMQGFIMEHDAMPDPAILPNSTTGCLASRVAENQAVQVCPGHKGVGFHLQSKELGESFFDSDDGIRITQLISKLEKIDRQSRFRVSIPKRMMHSMPPPPNDVISPPESVPDFNIEVQMAELQNPQHVDSCIDWLLQDSPDGIALVCKHGAGGSLGLIQLSTHQRCVLIKVLQPIAGLGKSVSLKLRELLFDREIVKVGLNIQRDALALDYFLGVVTNGCVRISQFVGTKRRKSLLNLCRELFHWEWSEKKEISSSNWTLKEISLEQVKYAALEAWTIRLVWVGQTEFWHIQPPSFSLGDFPWALLDYFGRSMFCFELQTRKNEDTLVEVKGARVELHQGYLSLKQKNFRSRVMGQKSSVELHFKDGRKPQKYVTLYREGSRVILDDAEPSLVVKTVENRLEEISMISRVLVDNSNNCDFQRQKLEESLYILLCIPGACPRHILVALGCVHNQSITIPRRSFRIEEEAVQNCKVGLNPGQLEAWNHMLMAPLSAVVGPPGTGKTTVIAAVVKAWLVLAGPGETLICAAHQNVAVRHMAEMIVKERLSGLLLLVSEDFFVGWHEDEYSNDVKEVMVVSGSQTTSALQSWVVRNGNAPPRLVLCTLSLIGNDSFHASLMGNTVSSMIIDECSQAAEGSLIPALGSLPHLQMLSVVGDPCQLPPYGLRPVRSVFDLLTQSCTVKQLREQYRMPYRVAQFVSTEFYGGRLHTDGSKMWQDSDGALLWVDVKGTVGATSGTSLSNQEESEAVVEWCKMWKRTCGGSAPRGKVVVLTLYEAQRSLISGMLAEEGMGEEVIVYNADSFQGQEAEVVVISLVVGARVSGFAADRRRACVLLSRARRQLILFGNLSAIQERKQRPFCNQSNSDNIWMTLANYCRSNGWVVSRYQDMSLEQQLCQST